MAVVVTLLATALVTEPELARFRALLPEDELSAAERMSDPRTHLCARALVRLSLSRVHEEDVAGGDLGRSAPHPNVAGGNYAGARPTKIDPRAWTIARTDAGKPHAMGPTSELSFNLSHTDGLVAVAVASTDVGIDVEPLARGPEILDTVLRAFAPAEIAALRALPADEQTRRAVELWTVKEAYLKGLGTGIGRHLDRFVVEAVDETCWRVPEAPPWRVHTRMVAERWIVATAAGANEQIAYRPA